MSPFFLSQSALIVVDMQQGFSQLCPDELPISGALEIVPVVNGLLDLGWRQIHASQDWHPPDHCSFLGQRENHYPPHCVQGTPGADFLPGLKTNRFQVIWRKGYVKDFEAYAITAQHPQFGAWLVASGVKQVFVCGLAINICCFETARDLCREKLKVSLIEDASAGIDVPSANLFQARAKQEGLTLGIDYVGSRDVIAMAS